MRRHVLLIGLLTSLLGGVSALQAQSYEGYLTSEKDGSRAPIWMDLRPGSGTGLVGTYFYKRVGTPLALNGMRTGAVLMLEERGADGRATGRFALTTFADSVAGTWSAPTGGTRFRVWLAPVDSSYRRLARVPTTDRVRLQDGRTLRAHRQGAIDDGATSTGPIRVTLHRRGIVVYAYDVTFVGAYATESTESFVYDVVTNREIVLSAELRPDRITNFWERIGTQLKAEVARWEGEMARRPDEDRLDPESLQEVRSSVRDDAAVGDRYGMSLTDEGIEVTTSGEAFGIPRAARSLGFEFRVQIPYAELGGYLRAGSPLLRLTQPILVP